MPAVQADLETRLTAVHIARELNCHPSAPIRWIQDGSQLSTGQRVKLQAVRTPGGWRIRREDLDQFLEILTADRLRPSVPAEPTTTPKTARVATMRTGLAEAGF